MEPDAINNTIPEQDAPAVSTEPTPQGESVEPTPTEPAPVEPAPVEPAPTEPAPTESVPIESTPTNPTPIDPTPTDSISTNPVQPAPTPEPTKTSHSKAILFAVLLLLLAVAGGVAIYLSLPSGQGSSGGEQINNNTSNQDAPIEKDKYDLSTISDFDLLFLKSKEDSQNIIYSPLSIKYALAMLADASANDSEVQIKKLIGDFRPKSYLNSNNLSLANAMFIREQVKDEILSSYTDGIKQKYNAEVVFDSFASEVNANKWISDKTLGIIKNTLGPEDINEDVDFLLINSLAIDMNWNYAIQCAYSSSQQGEGFPCKSYLVMPAHEDYFESINGFATSDSKGDFNGNQVVAAEIGTTANRYNIIEEIGEEAIRSTVLGEYEEYKQEQGEDGDFNIDNYMTQLGKNYGRLDNSSDFYYYDTDIEKVFAKDLREYDGTTLQYVGIMPKDEKLNSYIDNLDAETVSGLINNLKDVSDINSFEDGVVTKITGTIPIYNFSYNLNLKKDLMELGVTNVFDRNLADLTRMTSTPNSYIQNAIHKANIDFSNEGIKAAATTVLSGGIGGRGAFDYKWDVPVKEIDLSFDKPFFFIIRDKDTGAVWFTGKVCNLAE